MKHIVISEMAYWKIWQHKSEFNETFAKAVDELVELAETTGYPKRIGFHD